MSDDLISLKFFLRMNGVTIHAKGNYSQNLNGLKIYRGVY
jgi:hypothetical protein